MDIEGSNRHANEVPRWRRVVYKFMVLATAFLIHLVGDGISYTFGVFLTFIMKEYDETDSTVSLIGSILASIPLLTAGYSAIAVQRYGCKKVTMFGGLVAATGLYISSYSGSILHLILTFGVLTGMGLSLCFIAVPAVLNLNFGNKFSFAVGIATCGAGFGTGMYAPFNQYLIDTHGWRKAVQILSCTFLVIVGCGFLLENNAEEQTKKQKRERASSSSSSVQTGKDESIEMNIRPEAVCTVGQVQIESSCTTTTDDDDDNDDGIAVPKKKSRKFIIKLKNRLEQTSWKYLKYKPFFLFLTSNLIYFTWYDIPYMYVQASALKIGIQPMESSCLISAIGAANIVGNLVLGYLGDLEWVRVKKLYAVCALVSGINTVLIPWTLNWGYIPSLINCGIYGFTVAANLTLAPAILIEFFGTTHLENSYGAISVAQGFGNLVGPPSAGLISNLTGSNDMSFWLAGVGLIFSSFFCMTPSFLCKPPKGSGCNNVRNDANHDTTGCGADPVIQSLM